MIHTIVNVIRGEGFASAVRRAGERIDEAAHHAASRARSIVAGAAGAPILNVSAGSISPRSGGVATQLVPRLRAEQAFRSVALLHPGGLRLSVPFDHTRRIRASLFEERVREALTITGAKAIHLEGTFGVPIASMLRLLESGVAVVVSVHDVSLFGETLARQLLASATGVIFPSQFLLDQHREHFSLPRLSAQIVEPGIPDYGVHVEGERRGVAYAGSVKRHKGGHLLPALAERGVRLHVFGGGDLDLLQAMRHVPNIVIHGYYRAGALPSLLARHRIGLVVLPSIVPESYSLTLSEAWLAGASVAAFDVGAVAERIRRGGGGWLAPLESGTAGLVEIIDRWISGETSERTSVALPSPADAAKAIADLYRRWGLG